MPVFRNCKFVKKKKEFDFVWATMSVAMLDESLQAESFLTVREIQEAQLAG